MPPRPSDPANMPMARNKTSEGMPNRFESLIVKILRMTRVEKTMKMTSMGAGIVPLFFEVIRRDQMRSIAQTTGSR
jgi:hypothetical protein